MRFPLRAIAVAALLLVPAATGAEDVSDPAKVSQLLDIQDAPQLAPGEAGEFVVLLTNPYAGALRNSTFTAQVYFYATIEGGQPVDANWTSAFPRFASGTDATRREIAIPLGTFAPGTLTRRFTVETSPDMPHGSVFSQASYFVRFRIVFDYDNGTGEARYTMSSPGYFSRELWGRATDGTCSAPSRCAGNVNLSMLQVDGILPDSAFGVKEPIPIWPFWTLVAFMVFFLVLAFLFWVEENPAAFPRVERTWAVVRGKLRQMLPTRPRRPRS